ncbi:glycogen debranching protein GlgX [Neisseria dumasiana]|uniref:Glycogen debranching enzyme GlgX n=1 Tax=Neisseria dumasiana TaxID=1931275 RepID=A0ABX3WL50_9NEIS|nr:glycogen debranching protein GlgX [Neisseria dumasiana]OSI32814.1 glycogen debranching enzyme GlgX [Neisseria dumasiana]UOO83418.1 glycogen debranching protein GlgX [Neisseria dumasiana]
MTLLRQHHNGAEISGGLPYPLGATVRDGGVNFAVFSSSAEKIELCLFEGGTETRITLPAKSGGVFHGFVPNIAAGQRYGYRVYGTHYPELGLLFNPQKLLLDPYAKAVDGKPQYRNERELAHFHYRNGSDNAAVAPKSVVVEEQPFDWENDRHPNTPWAQTVIYEAHVKGLTKLMPDVQHAGTYAALADGRVIGRLKALGITAVELLPIQTHLDEYHLQQRGLSNYWGYNTCSHFAVETGYAADPQQAANELRRAVKALHQAGIEVILDVVYNHTAEQDLDVGLMLCQRGIDSPAWYWQDGEGRLCNWTGCGNTVQIAGHNATRWVMDSLRYWVQSFHIDGFRFDLGTVLGREPDFHSNARFFQTARQDPVLAGRKLIVEPWDIGAGGYSLGQFPYPFAEWNDRFRDDMRAFWLQDSGNVGIFAERLAGSSDIFQARSRQPSAGVNFITAHDGFTLQDLVSYNDKHNEANGEGNRDGHSHNLSWNHGAEGETDDAAVNLARSRTVKALLASLLLSNGTPMLTAGDESGNSQQGNNNGYCQDNEICWLDWHRRNEEREQYTRELLAVRREIPLLNEDVWWSSRRVQWLNSDGLEMKSRDWDDRTAKALQIRIDNKWLLLVNGKHSPQTFVLPHGRWVCRLAPEDVPVSVQPECSVSHAGIWIFVETGETV